MVIAGFIVYCREFVARGQCAGGPVGAGFGVRTRRMNVDFIALLVLRCLDEAIGIVDQVLLMGDKFTEGEV